MNETDLLERHFQSCIAQKDEFNFFLNISDYVDFIAETPKLLLILGEILLQKKTLEAEIDALHNKAVDEELVAIDKLIQIISENGIISPVLDNLFKEIDECRTNKSICSMSKAEELDDLLGDVLMWLKNNDYSHLIVNFAEFYKDDPKIIKRYTYAPTFSAYTDRKGVFEEQQNTSIWGAWNYLTLANLVISKKEEEKKKLSKDKKLTLDKMNLSFLIGEMNHIQKGKYNEISHHFFDKTKYASYLMRFHNYLLRQANLRKPSELSAPSSVKLGFYPEEGIAEYRGVSCSFRRGTKNFELLDFFFKSKQTPFNLEDIKAYCNKQIAIEKHQFKTEKDIIDTINYIKNKLKVRKGEYFPISKKEKIFIWEEK